MKHLYSLVLFCVAAGILGAQTTSVSVSTTVKTDPPIAQFMVDGFTYTGSHTFLWTEGTNHTIYAQPGQKTDNDETLLTVGGWSDDLGTTKGSNPITIVAKSGITTYTASVSVSYRVRFQFQSCGNDGSISPGTLLVGGTSITCDTTSYFSKGTSLDLIAAPSPHFAFVDWGGNVPQGAAAHTKYVVNGPSAIAAHFTYAKRLIFQSVPPGLQIYVDRNPIYTSGGGGNPDATFDIAPGKQIVLGAPEVQLDDHGKAWAFDSWSFGGGNNTVYTVDLGTGTDQTIVAKFVPAAVISVYSEPRGLPVSIDGRNNWAYSNFSWGVGSSHKISAPATAKDADGRSYVFKGWSNGGSADQTVQVTQDMVQKGTQIVAQYDLLSRVSMQTDPAGVKITVDGNACAAPCILDKASGSTAQASVPQTVQLDQDTKLVFAGWGDSTSATRSVTFSGADVQTLTAHYNRYYRVATNSDPANAVDFVLSPSSTDGYVQDGTYLTVTAKPHDGYKFIRFDGDVQGTSMTATTTVTGATRVLAILSKIPFVAPAGVRNAAGQTADGAVSPGSLISIFGENLATDTVVGPASPMAQTLAGTSVKLNDRILFLQFVSPKQVNAVMPQDIDEGKYTLTVTTVGFPDTPAPVTVERNAPGLFEQTVKDQSYVIAFHDDGSLITPDKPARRNEVITLWGTGFGPYDKHVVDGFATPLAPTYKLTDTVEVIIGNVSIQPQSTVALPGFVGISQTKVQMTKDLPNDTAPTIRVRVNSKDSNSSVLPLQSGVNGSGDPTTDGTEN